MPGQIAAGGPAHKIFVHFFELTAAISWCLVGLNYMFDSTGTGPRSPIGQIMHPYDYWWSTFYVLSAPAIFYGLLCNSQRFRIAGLNLLGVGLVMQWLAAMATAPTEPRDFIYLLYAFACFTTAFLAARFVTTSHAKQI